MEFFQIKKLPSHFLQAFLTLREYQFGFSCKRRGLCPSCNTKDMVETAAYLCDTLIHFVPMRQWVISSPMRIRQENEN